MDWVFWLFLVPIGLFFWTAFVVLFYFFGKEVFDDLWGDR